VITKKLSRKLEKRKREETTDKENELGIQTTLDTTFKKNPKGTKGLNGSVHPKGEPSKLSSK
jgi:hypothetical protein